MKTYDDHTEEEQQSVAAEPVAMAYVAEAPHAQISLDSVWQMLHTLDTDSKRWLMEQLSDDVHRERDITTTKEYKAAMADVAAGRVTEWNSVDESFLFSPYPQTEEDWERIEREAEESGVATDEEVKRVFDRWRNVG